MKTLLVYLFLVGTPLVGVFVILEYGEKLSAPPAVEGVWELDAGFVEQAAAACMPLRFREAPAVLTVSQSGQYLVLRFNDTGATSLSGKLEGTAVTAQGVDEPPTGACTAPATVRAVLVQATDAPDRFEGTWGASDCAGCTPVAFTAARPDTD